MNPSDAEIRKKIESVRLWYHRIPIHPGLVTPGHNDGETTLAHLQLPADCKGKRALDLGTRDGYFAFELERRGAEVVAIDYLPAEETGFSVAAELLDSKVRYVQDNVYNLSAERLGQFDVVLFLGLLYHLPDPMQILNNVRSLCRDRMYLETHVIDNFVLLPDGKTTTMKKLSPVCTQIPLMQFYPRRSLNNDPTNYWGPNVKCLEAMLAECRFEVVTHKLNGDRAIFQCRAVEDADLEYHNRIARGLNPRG
jgi:tRNA (mo5U34)-methyltransferase